jgi:hypothetical protein
MLGESCVDFLQHAKVSDVEAVLDIVDVLLIVLAQEWIVVEVEEISVGIRVVVELDVPVGSILGNILDRGDAVKIRGRIIREVGLVGVGFLLIGSGLSVLGCPSGSDDGHAIGDGDPLAP